MVDQEVGTTRPSACTLKQDVAGAHQRAAYRSLLFLFCVPPSTEPTVASLRRHRVLAPRYFLLAASLVVFSRTAGAQTWSGALDGAKAIPANLSQATGSVTVMLSGTTLVVLMSWNDLYRFPGGVAIHAVVPRESERNYAVFFPDFPAKQSGSYTARIDLSLASAYDAGFLRKHGDQVDAARAAFLAALNAGEGYVNVLSQNFSIPPEIGGRLVLLPERE